MLFFLLVFSEIDIIKWFISSKYFIALALLILLRQNHKSPPRPCACCSLAAWQLNGMAAVHLWWWRPLQGCLKSVKLTPQLSLHNPIGLMQSGVWLYLPVRPLNHKHCEDGTKDVQFDILKEEAESLPGIYVPPVLSQLETQDLNYHLALTFPSIERRTDAKCF